MFSLVHQTDLQKLIFVIDWWKRDKRIESHNREYILTQEKFSTTHVAEIFAKSKGWNLIKGAGFDEFAEATFCIDGSLYDLHIRRIEEFLLLAR